MKCEDDGRHPEGSCVKRQDELRLWVLVIAEVVCRVEDLRDLDGEVCAQASLCFWLGGCDAVLTGESLGPTQTAGGWGCV